MRLREIPVARAAVYAPGGRQPYPSSVVMGVATARAAGVAEVAVAAPAHPVILATCALCGADEVHRMGGAQAIAALALGTETIRPVDVIVGPGNAYVQEAKRQLSGRVGIDGFAGPSDLLVLGSAGADPRAAALDLLAQAEHGDDSLVVAVSDDTAWLDALSRELQALYRARPSVAMGPKVLVTAPDLECALAFAEALAPEHLELVGEAAEALAPRVTPRRLPVRRRRLRHGVRRLRGRLEPHAAHRRRRPVRLRPQRGPLPAPDERGPRRRRRGRARAGGGADRRGRGLRRPRRIDGGPSEWLR